MKEIGFISIRIIRFLRKIRGLQEYYNEKCI
jgi:hypothetical protein